MMTPSSVTPEIRALCADLVPGGTPQYINITPVAGTRILDCFANVENHIQRHGGSICFGWQIWNLLHFAVEAEFHAVWRDPTGKLIDITSKQFPVSKILFLPDPVRVYEGKQINNVRRALGSDASIQEYLDTLDAKFELMNRGHRASAVGQIVLSGAEMIEMEQIQEKETRLLKQIMRPTQTVTVVKNPGRNDLCYCGSGQKFKRCHGKNI
jgi:SEC-C motif